MTEVTDALSPGDSIADYRVDRVLGAGSFGVTYLARDMQLSRGVAIKEYMPVDYARRDASGTIGSRNAETAQTFAWGLDRFSDEARTLAHFNHPNIVKVMRLVTGVNGTAYIVMELLDGIHLEALVERDGPLEPDVFLSVFRQLLDGLAAIHALGILHRDIKPPNIVIKDETPVLIDFGAARDLAMQRKAGFSALVTDGYSPVEQYSREQEQRPASDIYALAATAYFLTTGRIPPSSAARAAGDRFASFAEANAGRFAPDILSAMDWALALKADDRPQSVAEWRARMPSIERAKDVPVVVVEGGARRIDRRALLIAGGGIVVAGAAAALFLGRDTTLDGDARPLGTAWERTVAKLYNEPFAALAATADGVLIAAHQVDAGGSDRLLALRLNDRGDTTGSYVLDRAGSRAHAILPAPDGGAYVGGDADGQALVVALDRNWAVRWSKAYDAGSVTSLMARDGGLIAGIEGPESSGKAKLLLLGPDGAETNDVTLLDRQGDSVQRIVQLSDGDIAVLGLRLEDRIVSGAKQQVAGLWVARVAQSGEERWRLAESGLGYAQGWDIAEAGGSIFIAGRTSRDGNANRLLLMRLDRDGKKLWSRWDYPGAPASGRGLAGVGGSSPRLYLAGWAGDPRRPRFSQLGADGTLAWDLVEPPAPGAGRSAAGIALRPDGTGFGIGLSSVSQDDLQLTVRRFT